LEKLIEYTPVFEANQDAYESGNYRVISNQGSSRSSKTFSICQLLITICLQVKREITVCSPSLPHLKRGARKDILDILKDWGIYNDNDFNKTDNVYRFPETGAYIEFFGTDEVAKLRGPGRDILYINEANLLTREAYMQLALRTKETIFIDFNPADEYSWVYDVSDAPGNKLIHSTYKNNLANLTKLQVQEIEGLKDVDENLWKVYGLGLRGTSSETIYTNWKMCHDFPQCEDIVYGLDFGYNHPTALVKVGFLDNKIYVDEALYESKLTNDDLAYVIKTMGITRSTEIFCDTARPESIEEIRRAGLNVKPAEKAVYEGIQIIKSRQLFVTARSTNIIKEIKSYKWKIDKDGRVLDEPVKFNDDAMDAMRYGVFSRLFKPKPIFSDAQY
jgi:phage terminase large subunit